MDMDTSCKEHAVRRLVLALVVALAATFALVGCGSGDADTGASTAPMTCPTDNTKAFPKTRFVADVGLIAGSFHHWIWKPYKEGKFDKGADGRTFALIKASGAALLIAKLTKNATSNVQASPVLCRTIGTPLQKLSNAASDLGSNIRHGDFSALTSVSGLLGTVTTGLGKRGLHVTQTHD